MAVELLSWQLAEFVQHLVGQPYWYGTHLQNCTQSLLDRKTSQFPDWYTGDKMVKLHQNIDDKLICSDCVGMVKGWAWTNGGVGVLEAIGTGEPIHQTIGSNNCPDKSANDMFQYAKDKGMQWGAVANIPEMPGLGLWLEGHCGVYIGNGEVVDFRGFALGCAKTKLANRNFVYWYQFPFVKYVNKTRFLPIGGHRRGKCTIYI